MMRYKEDEYLMLSGIQHYVFCPRQWALIHVEQQWAENYRTVDGKLMHKRAHDEKIREKRGDVIVTRSMAIASPTLGISGECDIVEFHTSTKGIHISGEKGSFAVVPVEYKRGRPKENLSDKLQLAAQALCLEEMLCCQIHEGYIYYGETRHRLKVEIDDDIRNTVKKIVNDMHRLYSRGYTPKAKRTKSCNACSLKDICLPLLEKKASVKEYIRSHFNEVQEYEETT